MLVPFSEYDLNLINTKHHEFNSEWVDKLEEFLATYKFKDEDISWKRNICCPSRQSYIDKYSITTEFKDLKYFYKYGYEKCGANKELNGCITITVFYYNVIDIKLQCPTIRKDVNYNTFFDGIIKNKYKGTYPEVLWGSNFLDLDKLTHTKSCKTVETAKKYIEQQFNYAFELIQEGIDWSTSESVQKQIEREYATKENIFKLQEKVLDIQGEIRAKTDEFYAYRKKCIEAFKRTRESFKDFV